MNYETPSIKVVNVNVEKFICASGEEAGGGASDFSRDGFVEDEE